MRTKTVFALIVAAGAAVASNANAANLIDFETIPGVGAPSDDMAIGDSYNTMDFAFVTFAFTDSTGMTDAFYEAVGTDSPANAFVSNKNGNDDSQLADIGGEAGLGSFLMRDNRDVTTTGQPLSLMINFNKALSDGIAPTGFSGQIWDIDDVSNENSASFGTEQWEVYVTDLLGNTELQATSPIGIEPSDPNSLDSKPWRFTVDDADGIAKIEVRFTGTKEAGLGGAFDNFEVRNVLPTPGTSALFSAGGLLIARRRRN